MSSRVAQKVTDAIRRRGRDILYRAPTGTNTVPPMINPPVLVAPVLAATVAAGDTTLAINATSARGLIVPNDILTLAGQQLIITDVVASRTVTVGVQPGFDDVPFFPPINAAQAAGTPLTATWSADVTVRAFVERYPERLVDGKNILVRDLRVKIGVFLCPITPDDTAELIIDGDIRKIINVDPVYAGPDQTSWEIQAR